MVTETNLDPVRRATLDRIDRAQSHFKLWCFAAAFVLLLLSAVATYSIVLLGLFALGAWDRRNTLLVLKGIEALPR
ncbi:MAG: hypothetical protein JO197_06660 [Acidobacteria bacterium]|nr:hypothetical protein [Acidobacteriota bacterium]MBV9477536.1 hypothetical protein [Acidobacteriota bacterium]